MLDQRILMKTNFVIRGDNRVITNNYRVNIEASCEKVMERAGEVGMEFKFFVQKG